jgi:hypothetical protein
MYMLHEWALGAWLRSVICSCASYNYVHSCPMCLGSIPIKLATLLRPLMLCQLFQISAILILAVADLLVLKLFIIVLIQLMF